MKLFFTVRNYRLDNIPEPPFIVTSNHASLMDPPMVGLACGKYPTDFMAKQELFDAPILGQWTKRVRCIPVDRGRNAIRGIKEALRRLKNGHVVGVFPEGTRSVDGNLREGKLGTGFLMLKSQVPVLPVYVYGTAAAFPKGRVVKLGARVGAVIGKPISPEEYIAIAGEDGKDYEAVSNLVMERIGEVKAEYEREYKINDK